MHQPVEPGSSAGVLRRWTLGSLPRCRVRAVDFSDGSIIRSSRADALQVGAWLVIHQQLDRTQRHLVPPSWRPGAPGFAGDLPGILADYAPDAVMFTPTGVVRGPEGMTPLLQGFFAEFAKPGARFDLQLQSVEGDVAYI